MNPQEMIREKEALSYECDICKKYVSSKRNLTLHKRIHAGGKQYHCDICGKSFLRKSNLTSHKYAHTGDKPYQFKSKLSTHEFTHTNERPYQCDICGKSFSHRIKSELTVHEFTYTNERPYQCDICGNLTSHKSIHRVQKPYQYDICDHPNKSCARDTNINYRIHTLDQCMRNVTFLQTDLQYVIWDDSVIKEFLHQIHHEY
ncbi:zinc finger protein 253 [Octopus bimaculoides]|uniref:zinc finger protein 253 n=1 Tax=Octopus bimaculoides TaxID=37653 RepID=UPI0022E593FC|nr:zinc finger protein 253 [Octopus bimaculoides]